MSDRGAYIVASNSDPKNTDEDDNFFDTLYSAYKISRIQANRAINSNSAKRGKVRELLICSGDKAADAKAIIFKEAIGMRIVEKSRGFINPDTIIMALKNTSHRL